MGDELANYNNCTEVLNYIVDHIEMLPIQDIILYLYDKQDQEVPWEHITQIKTAIKAAPRNYLNADDIEKILEYTHNHNDGVCELEEAKEIVNI